MNRHLEGIPGELRGTESQVAQLTTTIAGYLNERIVSPILDAVLTDPTVSIRWTQAFVLLRLSENLITDHDLETRTIQLEQRIVPFFQDTEKKAVYLGYLGKVLHSSLILMGSTDYIGSLVLLRSVFELLVGIATEQTGGMKGRIWSIAFLSESEKANLYDLWNQLNPWAHPYRKWQEEVCPILYGCGEHFHPKLFEACLDYLERILDFMLIITVERFGVKPQSYMDAYRQISAGSSPFDVSILKMLHSRLIKSADEAGP